MLDRLERSRRQNPEITCPVGDIKLSVIYEYNDGQDAPHEVIVEDPEGQNSSHFGISKSEAVRSAEYHIMTGCIARGCYPDKCYLSNLKQQKERDH